MEITEKHKKALEINKAKDSIKHFKSLLNNQTAKGEMINPQFNGKISRNGYNG